MQEDVAGAVQFVEKEVRRLLEGGCELSEMVMTGGLWRLTGMPAVTFLETTIVKGLSLCKDTLATRKS